MGSGGVMIMTHGSIDNVVSGNGTALNFESGESWSEVLLGPHSKVDRVLPDRVMWRAPFVDLAHSLTPLFSGLRSVNVA